MKSGASKTPPQVPINQLGHRTSLVPEFGLAIRLGACTADLYNPRPALAAAADRVAWGSAMNYCRLCTNVLVTLAAASSLGMGGCHTIRMPNFAHPGTAQQQRADAERWDPYPDPDAGPPVVGGRPLGYTRPLTEADWSRRFGAPPGGISPGPVATFTVPPAPVVTNPFSPSPPAVVVPNAPPIVPSPTTPGTVQPRSPY
jgi:hypothetical protein